MHWYGVPSKLISVIKALHHNTLVKVRVNDKTSVPFEVTNGVNKGAFSPQCFFIIFIDFILRMTIKRLGLGVTIVYREDGKLTGRSSKKFYGPLTINHLLYADDMVIAARTKEDLDLLIQIFESLTRRFDLCISVAKTKTMAVQSADSNGEKEIEILIRGEKLEQVKVFPYLGSKVADNNDIAQEVSSRIQKASAAFSKLKKTVWSRKEIPLSTKGKVFNAVVMA